MPVFPTPDHAQLLLAALAEALAADGYSLRVVNLDAVGLHITLEASDDACADCLVPIDLFRGIVTTTLAAGGMSIPEQCIQVIYPNNDL